MRWLVGSVLGVVACVVLVSCTCDKSRNRLIDSSAAPKCERGVNAAMDQETIQGKMGTYYRECASIHAEAACRDAWIQAASKPLEDQQRTIVEGCAKAYCPHFEGRGFEMCRSDFTYSEESFKRAWPPFHGAVMERDTGPDVDQVRRAILRLYLHLQMKKVAEQQASSAAPPAGSAAPAESAAPPLQSAAAPSPAAPSASAAP